MGDDVPVPQPPRLAFLPEFRAEIEWLTLSTRLISIATPDNNTHFFLTIYRALPTDLQKDYKNLLLSEEINTYEALRTELTNRFTIPDHAKFNALYNLETIGDRSPMQFLRDLRRKFTDADETNLEHLRYAFAMGMTPEYRNVILSQGATHLDETAKMADDMWHINTSSKSALPINATNFHAPSHFPKPPTTFASVPASNDNNKLCDLILDLSAQITTMSSRINQLESQSSRNTGTNYAVAQKQKLINPEQRSSNSHRRGCPPPPSDTNRFNLCYYHACFGRKARKCNDPCQWPNVKIPPHQCNQSPCPWDIFNLN